MAKKQLIVTLGDPAGIGPEVIVKALLQMPPAILSKSKIYGEAWILKKTTENVLKKNPGLEKNIGAIKVKSFGLLKEGDYALGRLSTKCGAAAFKYFEQAIRDCRKGSAIGIVTAPINKEALQMAGQQFTGHTNILEKLAGHTTVMSIFHPKLIVSHVTDHIPLREVPGAVTQERVETVIEHTRNAAEKFLKKIPRLAVAGLNPHAGENGILGNEEREIMLPLIKKLKRKGVVISGPLPGDTIFFEALQGRFDVVIAMYHDQGFGPMKTLDFHHSVNCTLGLPFVRTSPDHGTAFNIAKNFSANPQSMVEAWTLAARLSE